VDERSYILKDDNYDFRIDWRDKDHVKKGKYPKNLIIVFK